MKFRYAAIKRYGERNWTAGSGWVEFNPNYTVSVSKDETKLFGDSRNAAYVVELSNGTKFLAFVNNAVLGDAEILTEDGEAANWAAEDRAEADVEIYIKDYNRLKSTYTK